MFVVTFPPLQQILVEQVLEVHVSVTLVWLSLLLALRFLLICLQEQHLESFQNRDVAFGTGFQQG